MSDFPLFIHSTLDDMTDVTPNAMRVYMHLSRRADHVGKAWPSYQSIGDHCFTSVSDNPVTRRSFARKAIDELIDAQLIVKEERARDDGGQTSNGYVLAPLLCTQTPMPIGTPMPIKHPPCLLDTPHAYKAPEDTPIEDTPMKEEDDDAHARDGIHQAWLDVLGDDVPANIETPLQNLLVECGEPAVIHGILAIPQSGSRSFKFIAACARNYIPPAPPGNEEGKSYQVDPYPYRGDQGDQASIQGDPSVARKPPPPPAAANAPPKPTDDVWTIALAEMKYALPGAAVSYLDGSTMEAAGSVDNVPLYHIVVKERAEAGLGWLTAQAGPAIRRKLSTLFGKSVLIEIVCMEPVS